MKHLAKYVNNTAGLQTFQIMRFVSFLIISVVLTKSHLSTYEIGDFEALLFIASAVSFFWLTGLIQSFLPLYNDNAAFPGEKIDTEHKSPEIFNAFLLISFFSVLIFLFGHIVKHNVYIYTNVKQVPHINLLLVYVLISNPTHLVEYIYLLRNKSQQIINYGIITHIAQLILVIAPIKFGFGIREAIIGLVIISGFRFVWLIMLLLKYAEFKISFSFIKAHIHLAFPLIISSMLTGSAQYIDGLVVVNKFDSRAFALFRYGAKELPFVVLLAGGLHGAMLPEFVKKDNLLNTLQTLKKKTNRLFHILFPMSIVFLFFSNYIFPNLFNENFVRSADIFMVYILLIISRLLFPNTVLIGLKKTNIILYASIIGAVLNVLLSLYLIKFYALVGVALATVILQLIEKIILVTYVQVKLKISFNTYTPILNYLLYSAILITVFILIDRKILQVF